MTVFAGRFSLSGGAGAQPADALVEALRRDGPAELLERGPLAVAWTGHGAVSPAHDCDCVIDGRPDTRALAEELGTSPSAPPEKLVGAGFQRVGAGVLERLGGEFALVVWDAERGRGLLARDAIGARPLFWTRARGALLFASEVRNLLALLPSRPAPDAEALAHWLAGTRTARDLTLYDGIARLAPAHALAFEIGHEPRRPVRYWQPRYKPPARVDRAEAAARVRDGVGAAVERSLHGAERPAVMLSGGLDSAMVAAAVRGRGTLRAYSAVFPRQPQVDESEAIARVRDWLGAGGVEQRFVSASALVAGAEFTREWELPSATPNLFVWLPLLRRAASDGVDVMLDGEGGDELFGCARYLVADRLRERGPIAALRVARRLPGMGEQPRPRWLLRALAAYGARGALPPALHARLRTARSRGLAAPPWLEEAAARVHLEHDDPWAWKRTPAPRWWADLAHALTTRGETLGAADQLRREGLLAGVELRHPLRDRELIELVLALPPEYAFDPRLDRPLARHAFAGALPAETLEGDAKPAFNALLAGAFGGPDAGLLRQLLAEPHPELARRVRADVLGTMLDHPPGSAAQRAWHLALWRLAATELWLRHCEDPGGQGLPEPGAAVSEDVSFAEVRVPTRQLRDRA